MKKQEFYRRVYRAEASYNPDKGGLKVRSLELCLFKVPKPIRKKCLLAAAMTAKDLPGLKVTSYYDFDCGLVSTRAEIPKPVEESEDKD